MRRQRISRSSTAEKLSARGCLNFLTTSRPALYSPGSHGHNNPSTQVTTLEHQAVIHLLLTSLRMLCEVRFRRVLGHRRHPDWSWAQEVAAPSVFTMDAAP